MVIAIKIKLSYSAYTNKEINSERWGATHRKIDDLSVCPQNIILDLFRLLVIPYSYILLKT